MSFWNWITRRRTDHGWPAYIINGRIRTSTAALIVAFFAISWVHNTYRPPPPAPAAPTEQVVPPGFVPDPEYTWVPRTNVQERPKTTTPTTTTEPSPTETTSPTSPTSPTEPGPTTIVDPDGPGPSTATTVAPTTGATIVPGLPFTLPGPTPTAPTTLSPPLAPPR